MSSFHSKFLPALDIAAGARPGAGENRHRGQDTAGIIFHAVNRLHQFRDTANRLAEILGLQYLAGDKLIDAADRFIGHKIGEGAGRVFGLAIRHRLFFTAQNAVEAT